MSVAFQQNTGRRRSEAVRSGAWLRRLGMAAWLFVLPVLSADEYDRNYAPGAEFTTFYPVPMEHCGLYFPEETPVQVIGVRNTGKTPEQLSLKLRVVDYQGNTLEQKNISIQCAPGIQQVRQIALTRPEKCGYYTVEAELFSGKTKCARRQSAFVTLSRQRGRRDPFFGANQVSTIYGKMPGLARTGFGTLEFGLCPFQYMDAYPWIYQTPHVRVRKKCPESFIDWFHSCRNVDEMIRLGFKVIGHIGVDIPQLPVRERRIKENLFAATDEDLKINAVIAESAAARYRGKIKMWVIGQEVDAHAMTTRPDCGFALAQLTDYVLRCKQAISGIKKGNPDAKITIMPSMCFDWSRNEPKFLYSKLIMNDLGESFDYYGADVYVNAGDARRGPLIPPEKDDAYRRCLLDAAKLSKSFNRPELVFNNERGYGVLYFDRLDCEVNRNQGTYTARSLILTRAANVCPYFSLHLTCMGSFSDRAARNLLKPGKHTDYGIWKGVCTENRGERVFAKIPRPAVALVAVAARELAFVKNGVQRKFGDDVYACSFDAPEGKQVIALWTTRIVSGADTIAEGVPDVEMLLNDGWDNSTRLPSGKALKLRLTEVPVYLRFTGNAAQSKALLEKMKFRMDAPLRAFGRRIDAATIRFQFNNPRAEAEKAVIFWQGKKREFTLMPGIRFMDFPSSSNGAAAKLTSGGGELEFPVDARAIRVKRLNSAPVFDGGSWFGSAAQVTLTPQESVFPEIARMAEAGYFKMDGSDKPVRFYYAYDRNHLYVGARTPDVCHQQRFSGKELWRGDSLQFAVSARNDFIAERVAKSSKNNDFGPREHNYGIALCNGKSVIYEYAKKGGFRNYPVRVTRRDSETVYEAAVPLASIGVAPRRGNGFFAAAAIFNSDRASDQYPPYYYAHGRGVAGGQNLSQFLTFIME